MAEPREISGRPLPSVLEQQLQQRQQQQQQQQEQHRTEDPPAKATFQSKDKRRKRLLTSLNGAIAETKPVLSRRRPGSTNKSTATPQADDFRTAQQSTVSSRAISSTMSAVHYTRTGRVSKAKKGLKVHDCDCGRVSVFRLLFYNCHMDDACILHLCARYFLTFADLCQSYTRAEHLRYNNLRLLMPILLT